MFELANNFNIFKISQSLLNVLHENPLFKIVFIQLQKIDVKHTDVHKKQK